MCKNWITGDASKFHIGVSDNAANVTLALNSGVILEAPPEICDRALTDTEGSDGYDEDDDDDPFPPLAPMHEGSAGCFAHLLNLIVEVYTYLNAFINIVYFTMLIHTLIHVNIMTADSMIVVTSNCF